MIDKAYAQCLKKLSSKNLAQMELSASQTGGPGAIAMVAKAARMKSGTAILRELDKKQMQAWSFDHISARQSPFQQNKLLVA